MDFLRFYTGGRMGQKDLTGKNFLLHRDVYADTLNALAYAGREVVHAGDLLSAPTESFYPVGRGRLANQFSDVSMYEMKNGSIHVQYIFENEVQAKYRTVLRKAGYEGALYRGQLDGEDVYPIVSLLLYWSTPPWKQPISIKELFKQSELDGSTWKFIINGKLHVYSMAHLPKQVRNRFHSDMRIVVDYLAEKQNFKPTKQRIVHLESLLLMLQALTGDRRYLKILRSMTEEDKKGEMTMCELLDKYENRGIQKGIKQGIQQGIQQGEARYAALNEKLITLGRMDDLCKAAGSKRYRSQLYKELAL